MLGEGPGALGTPRGARRRLDFGDAEVPGRRGPELERPERVTQMGLDVGGAAVAGVGIVGPGGGLCRSIDDGLSGAVCTRGGSTSHPPATACGTIQRTAHKCPLPCCCSAAVALRYVVLAAVLLLCCCAAVL